MGRSGPHPELQVLGRRRRDYRGGLAVRAGHRVGQIVVDAGSRAAWGSTLGEARLLLRLDILLRQLRLGRPRDIPAGVSST